MGIFIYIILLLVTFGIVIAGIFTKKNSIIIIGILSFIVMCFVGCKIISYQQQEQIYHLENIIAELKQELVPLKFKVLKSSENEIEIETSFYDLEDKCFAKKQLKLDGEELFFDFQVIKLDKNNYMFFPTKVYTNLMAPENGIDLTNFYNNKGFPEIYNKLENFLSDENKKTYSAYKEKIVSVFNYVREDNLDFIDEQFGNAVHDMKEISKFKKGYSYKIICHPHTGSIEIQKI